LTRVIWLWSLFTATTGLAWNFGSLAFFRGSGLVIWRIDADGKIQTGTKP